MKQTVTSKYEPKSKNVTWIDMSTGSPVQKNYINGRWMPTGGSGGGAGSSNPTEADATKVWQVTPVQKGTKTEETVIVPEQTLVDGQDLEYNDKFVLGAQCVAVVNGVEYRGEVVEGKEDNYIFEAEFGGFVYNRVMGVFRFYKNTEPEVTAKLSVIEETPIYDYNWAPGVKIPIPTAEDEGKILIVTKVSGDNTSIIIPEQSVSNGEYFQNSDISKFVVGNEVKYTIGVGVISFTKTGLIINDGGYDVVELYNLSNTKLGAIVLENTEDGKALKFYKPGISFGKTTIKLEYIESNYEYQLQKNNGGSSDVLWPALYEDENGNEIMATFVSEDVKPNTWCMVRGTDSDSRPVCYPVLINSYHNYTLCSGVGGFDITVSTAFDGVGELLTISGAVESY